VIGLVVAPLLPIMGLLFLLAAERLEQSHDFTGQMTMSRRATRAAASSSISRIGTHTDRRERVDAAC